MKQQFGCKVCLCKSSQHCHSTRMLIVNISQAKMPPRRESKLGHPARWRKQIVMEKKNTSSCVSSAPQRIQENEKSTTNKEWQCWFSFKLCQSQPRLHLSSVRHSPRYLPLHLSICWAGAAVHTASVSSSAVTDGHPSPSRQLHFVGDRDAEDLQRVLIFCCSAPSVCPLWTANQTRRLWRSSNLQKKASKLEHQAGRNLAVFTFAYQCTLVTNTALLLLTALNGKCYQKHCACLRMHLRSGESLSGALTAIN